MADDKAAPRREPKQSRSKDTFEVLLDAAEKILKSEGPAALSTKHVAATAGVGVGTLYQYFPGKEAIVVALERRMWARALEGLKETLASVANEPIDVAINTVVHAAVEQLWPSTELHGWTLPDRLAPPVRNDVADITKVAVELVASVLTANPDKLHAKTPRLTAALAIHAVTNLIRVTVRDFPEAARSGELATELTRMITSYLVIK